MGYMRGKTTQDDVILNRNSKISRVSCVPKPSHIRTRGLWLARALVCGSNTRLSHSKLIIESVYPDLEYV